MGNAGKHTSQVAVWREVLDELGNGSTATLDLFYSKGQALGSILLTRRVLWKLRLLLDKTPHSVEDSDRQVKDLIGFWSARPAPDGAAAAARDAAPTSARNGGADAVRGAAPTSARDVAGRITPDAAASPVVAGADDGPDGAADAARGIGGADAPQVRQWRPVEVLVASLLVAMLTMCSAGRR